MHFVNLPGDFSRSFSRLASFCFPGEPTTLLPLQGHVCVVRSQLRVFISLKTPLTPQSLGFLNLFLKTCISVCIFGYAESLLLCRVSSSSDEQEATRYLQCTDFSLQCLLLLQSMGSVAMMHGLSCSKACEIFPDQGSFQCLLHWQVDSLLLSHPGSPSPDPLILKLFAFLGQMVLDFPEDECFHSNHPSFVSEVLLHCSEMLFRCFFLFQSLGVGGILIHRQGTVSISEEHP